ncbi:MAG: TetR/AcrR family transcriptional regulator [Desulfobacterales bacterium]|nr:TetR/AcrR family transcriptional regulator [Desulfobacterales bacterium]
MRGYSRGERQAVRTKTSLVTAFSVLLRERNYADITVTDIITRADTGRSTFYRYFKSKADLLVFLHGDRFDKLLASLASEPAWLDDVPPRELISFLTMFRGMGERPFSLAYMLGNDMDYVIHHINRLLSVKFEKNLRAAFAHRTTRIPFDVLSLSIAGSYCWVIISWLKGDIEYSPEEAAAYVHRLARAAIRSAMVL